MNFLRYVFEIDNVSLINQLLTCLGTQCVVCKNKKSGITCDDESEITLIGCKLEKNGENGINLKGRSRATIHGSHVVYNTLLPIDKEVGCTATCSGNFCTTPSPTVSVPPGFQLI